jgi:hypothetical protein
LVDLDADGYLDLISGSWPGEIFLFKGGPDHSFAAPVKLRDKDGKTINVGGMIRREAGGGILITGDATWKTEDGKTFVEYEGERFESTAENPISTTGCASAVHAVDWDGDGDLDLLVGEIGGSVYLVPNEGTPQTYAFGKKQELSVEGTPRFSLSSLVQTVRKGAAPSGVHVEGDAGPFTADWDGDGDLDLLVGAGDGSVTLFRNTGGSLPPRLAAGEILVPGVQAIFGPDSPETPQRGVRSKVCAVDWNGDGRLDLLVGDFTTQKPKREAVSPEEEARIAKLRAEQTELQTKYGAVVQKLFGPNRVKDKEGMDRATTEAKALRDAMVALSEKLPPEYENHGWVWLFLRKPSEGN